MSFFEDSAKLNKIVRAVEQLFKGDDATDVTYDGVTKPSFDKRISGIVTAAAISAGVYENTAAGLAATADGEYFSVPSAENDEYLILYLNDTGSAVEVKRYPSKAAIDGIPVGTIASDDIAWAVVDNNGFTYLWLGLDGQLHAPKLSVDVISGDDVDLELVESGEFVYAIADAGGNVVFGVKASGEVYPPPAVIPDGLVSEWRTLEIGADDSIVHIGDSYTASHYTLKDKAYISDLSALSPYRHINFGVSGDDSLDMQYRIVNESLYNAEVFSDMNARYAFITSLTNDGAFRASDLAFYAENIRRLVETVKAVGAEPVLATEFPASTDEHALLRAIATEHGCAFLDCTTLNAEIGGLTAGAFHQGHPGTRTNGVFWLSMLDFIDRMPKPDRAIKIYRKRVTFSAGSIADLLYTGRLERNAKWKELTLAHFSLKEIEKFEELDQLGVFSYDQHMDEYLGLASGGSVAVTDYALINVTLDCNASTLDAVEISMSLDASATVYVRNYLDIPASMPGKRQGSAPADSTYLGKWDTPRGAWRQVALDSGDLTVLITGSDLRRSMQGRELSILIDGAANLSALSVRYKGRESISDLSEKAAPKIIGSNLLLQPLCGTAPQLADWTSYGSPAAIIPVDVYDAPTKPGTTSRIDGVCVISAADMIGQVITLPADEGRVRRYQVRVWARHYPKAFLTPAKYPTFDANQIVDRVIYPNGATITTDTNDLRTLKAEVWSGTSMPSNGGAEFFNFVALQWRPVDFVYEVLPYKSAEIAFRLSCIDGDIQVGKVTINEVI